MPGSSHQPTSRRGGAIIDRDRPDLRRPSRRNSRPRAGSSGTAAECVPGPVVPSGNKATGLSPSSALAMAMRLVLRALHVAALDVDRRVLVGEPVDAAGDRARPSTRTRIRSRRRGSRMSSQLVWLQMSKRVRRESAPGHSNARADDPRAPRRGSVAARASGRAAACVSEVERARRPANSRTAAAMRSDRASVRLARRRA